MSIYVRFSGVHHQAIQLYARPDETVRSLRNRILRQTGITASRTELFFNGNRLDDDKTLSYYQIQDGKCRHKMGKYS